MDKSTYTHALKAAILGACIDTNFEVFLLFFGQKIAKENGWQSINERDAVLLYLVKKYNWTLS
jgi:hypothetical protein